MRVAEVMARPVSSCTEETTLAAAARRMSENDCGALPVLRGGRVVGVVTDRDACLALGYERRIANDVPVGDVMTREVTVCGPDDDLHTALALMSTRQVRRLPVVDAAGKLAGILSLDDVVVRAEEPDPSRRPPEISCREVVATLRAICGSRRVRPAASLTRP